MPQLTSYESARGYFDNVGSSDAKKSHNLMLVNKKINTSIVI